MIQSLIRITLFARLLIPHPKSYLFCRRLNSGGEGGGGYLISRSDRTSSFLPPLLSFPPPFSYRLARLSSPLRPSNYFQPGSSLKENSIARLITVAFLFPASKSFALLPYPTFVIHLWSLLPSAPPPLFQRSLLFLQFGILFFCPLQLDVYFVQINDRSKCRFFRERETIPALLLTRGFPRKTRALFNSCLTRRIFMKKTKDSARAV